MRFILSIISMIVVYGAINLVLVGGQHAWHAKDQARLDAIQSDMSSKKADIERLEVSIKEIERTCSADNPPSPEIYADYQRDIEDHNRLVDEYNTELPEAKGLAETVGSTWMIFPLPRIGGH